MNGYELVYKNIHNDNLFLFVTVVAKDEERAIKIVNDSIDPRTYVFEKTHLVMKSEGVLTFNTFEV